MNEQELDRGPGQERSPPMHPHSGFCGQAAGREERTRSLDRGEALHHRGKARLHQEPHACMAQGWGQPMSMLEKIWKAEKRKEQIMILQWPLQAGIQADQIYGPKSSLPLWGCRQVQSAEAAPTEAAEGSPGWATGQRLCISCNAPVSQPFRRPCKPSPPGFPAFLFGMPKNAFLNLGAPCWRRWPLQSSPP